MVFLNVLPSFGYAVVLVHKSPKCLYSIKSERDAGVSKTYSRGKSHFIVKCHQIFPFSGYYLIDFTKGCNLAMTEVFLFSTEFSSSAENVVNLEELAICHLATHT